MLDTVTLARQADEEARGKILQELGVSFLVEAGAGSGKTTSLVGRMVNLIRHGKADIGEIAAITFTNKAASELSGRFRLKLEEALRAAAADGPERERLERAVREYGRGFIGTIHSFCGRLLRERPIEARLDPGFREIDEAESKELRDRTWDDYLERLRGDGRDAAFQELLELGVQPEELRAVYHRVSQYEDVVIFTKDMVLPDFDLIRLSLPDMVREAAACIPGATPEKGWDSLQETVRHAVRFLRNMDLDDDRAVLDLAKLFDRTLDVTQNRWTDKGEAKRFKEAFLEWQRSVLKPFLEAWREYLHPQLIRFVLPAVQFARTKRMEAGLLDFQDLLMKAAALLREYPDVRAYFGRTYTRLLVDEFQDTDPIQAEMMLLLTGSLPEESNWRRQVPRPGSLFIVGDPKQSIYRFRRADISTYNFVKARIAAHGEVLQLTQNFRSVRSIGDYVNYAFESKFIPPGEQADHQANYSLMLTKRDNPKGKQLTHGVYVLTVPKQERDRKAAIADYDAERIARRIAWACRGGLRVQEPDGPGGKPMQRPAHPGDFMILLKRREFIGLYAAKLESCGIPSDTSGDRAGGAELDALQALAECLGDYTDPVLLLAVLRGPLFGLSDEALFHYAMEMGRVAMFPAAEEGALTPKAAPVGEALRRTRAYWGAVRSLPAAVAFGRIVGDLGLIPYAAVRETGAIRSGTLVKLLELIRRELPASASWHEMTAFLRRLRENDGIEGTGLFAGTGGAVRVMNLHKAKGLEAPVVFLAAPCGNIDHDAEEHVDRSAEPALGYFTIRRDKDAYTQETVAQPAGWAEKSEKERIYQHAEEERLLYVAATRAKQLLVVSLYPSRPAIDPWAKLAAGLQRQPELELEKAAAEAERELLATAPDPAEALMPWRQWLDAAMRPTYSRTSVTALAKAAGDAALPRPAEGRGMAFGSVVHRCIDALGGGLSPERLDAYMQLAAEEEELDAKWLPDASAAVRRVLASRLWRRSRAAKQAHHEFSFMVRETEETAAAAGAEPAPRLLKGVVDLAFEEEDGWVIADFKTDLLEEEHLEAFVRFYAPQVRAYAERWEKTLGLPVKEAGLYFVQLEKYVRV